MNDLRLQLDPVMDPAAIAVLMLALAALVWLRPRFGNLTRGRWATLVALRLAVLLLALVAMLRPELVYTKVTRQRATLALLVDASRSMQVADSLGEATRWNSLQALLDEAAGDLAALGEAWDVVVYQFDAETTPLEFHDGAVALPAEPQGGQSALGAAIHDVLERQAGGRVAGLLLLSDGAQRAIAPRDLPPQVAVRRMVAENVPLYTFTFGKSGGSQRADLGIDDFVTNETIFAEAPTEVRGQLRVQGFANQRVPVQLLWESADGDEMEVVDTELVSTGSQDRAIPVTLRHTPQTPGEYKATLRVDPRDNELVTTNNEASTFVTVREGGINVLYLVGAKRIGGGPGAEQRFVRAALARSPDIVVERRLLDYDPGEEDLRETFRRGEFDVVILDDVDAQALSRESWQALAEQVNAGTGLMMTGGYHSFGPGGHRDSPLADVLPLDLGPAQRQSFGEPPRSDMHLAGPVRMRPAAPLGVRHSIMQIETAPDRNAENAAPADASSTGPWTELPPLDGANLIERRELKGNAQVLAETLEASPHPLLVAGQSGSGRTLAFAGDSTWRWQMQGFGDVHRRFWRQAMLWLVKKDQQTEGRVWIDLAGRRVMRGSGVEFTFGAEGPQGEPLESAQFDVAVETPDGREVPLRATRRGDNWSATFRDTAAAGDYQIKVSAADAAAAAERAPADPGEKAPSPSLGSAEARFLVPDHDIELDRPAAEPSLMAQLAELTAPAGGRALAPEELPALLAELAAAPPQLEEEVMARTTYWDKWPFFLAFVGLLATEWYLRKRWGLV